MQTRIGIRGRHRAGEAAVRLQHSQNSSKHNKQTPDQIVRAERQTGLVSQSTHASISLYAPCAPTHPLAVVVAEDEAWARAKDGAGCIRSSNVLQREAPGRTERNQRRRPCTRPRVRTFGADQQRREAGGGREDGGARHRGGEHDARCLVLTHGACSDDATCAAHVVRTWRKPGLVPTEYLLSTYGRSTYGVCAVHPGARSWPVMSPRAETQ